jgi:hypothetical protein
MGKGDKYARRKKVKLINNEIVNPVHVFCKMGDVSLDGEGNIVIFIAKDKATSAQKTANILKRFKGKDITLSINQFIRKEDAAAEMMSNPLQGLGESTHLDR